MKIWKDVVGFEGLYEVSNRGRVRSLIKGQRGGTVKRSKPYILSQPLTNAGYKRVTLFKNRKRHLHSVHRLVAKAFIPNPENKPEVNHLDGVKINNFDYNLEWCTKSENAIHSFEIGLQSYDDIISRFNWQKGEKCPSSKLTRKEVISIRETAKKRGRFYGRKDLADKHNVCEETIKSVVNRRSWQHL